MGIAKSVATGLLVAASIAVGLVLAVCIAVQWAWCKARGVPYDLDGALGPSV